jgi:general secretion pathway protein K
LRAPRLSRATRQRPRVGRRAQRGIALIVAILIVALGTIVAAAVAYENAMTARRSSGALAMDQAILVAQGAEALAASGLRTLHQSDPQHTYPGQGWDKPVGPFEVVPGVSLTASLEDLQGRFNLNNLVNKEGIPDTVNTSAFTQLLMAVGLEPKWTGLVIDWIDADIVPQNPEGAEDSVYMGQVPPYRTANRYITSTTELLALPGFGRDRYMKIAPYITALPYGTKINVCSASGVLLDAFLGNGHSEFGADAEGLAKNRQTTSGCFPTLANFVALLPKTPTPTPSTGSVTGGLPVGSSSGSASGKFGQASIYFRLTSYIEIGSTEFNLYSLLYQDQTGAVRPLQRSFTPD